MSLIAIAFKSIRQRALASSLTSLSVALGVALMIAVMIINTVVSSMFSQTGTGYDLVVGPRGSRFQLVLSAIYRIDRPIENLPWRFYQQLKSDPRVARAIPVAIGDTTEQGQFPIVGTTPEYMVVNYAEGKKLTLRGENLYGPWDAVIGSDVARSNGWDVGAQFRMVHGGTDEHVHDEKFTVTGVLKRTNSPNDRSVFVNLEGFLRLAGHDKPIDEALAREADAFHETIEQVRTRYADEIKEAEEHEAEEHGGHAHHHDHPLPTVQREITAVLVVCKGNDPVRRASNTMQLEADLKEGFVALGVNPVAVMREIMNGLLSNVRLAVLVLTGLIIAVSGIGIFVSIYNSMSDRRREIAIMRALGAQRGTVFAIVLLESLLLCVGGGILGLILGHGLVLVGAPLVAARSGLVINPLAGDQLELVIIPVMVVMASLVGFLPAMTAYRTDVAEGLSQ